ncbi:MAG: hypothetical protein JSR82_21880 [Verrucomicrobia bacterium]|nr:hypothetical protein [Verrucomicrobiota bacterium]
MPSTTFIPRPETPAALAPGAESVRYYESMRGRWAGRYRFAVTNPTALKVHVRAPLDRLRLRMMHRFKGGTMHTSVAWAGPDLVRHTTSVRVLGLPALHGVELFHLQADGRQLVVEMTQRLAPDFWRVRTFPGGTGRVRGDGESAYYRLPWLGGTIEQKVRRTGPQEVELRQEAAWFEAKASLRRLP